VDIHVGDHEHQALSGEAQVWRNLMCELYEKNGSVQGGYRPVFVLSNNKNNAFSPTLNVIPLTSKVGKNNLPIHVDLRDYERYGLRKASTLLIEQITTVSVKQLSIRIGEINDTATLSRIYQALEIQFPIVRMFS